MDTQQQLKWWPAISWVTGWLLSLTLFLLSWGAWA